MNLFHSVLFCSLSLSLPLSLFISLFLLQASCVRFLSCVVFGVFFYLLITMFSLLPPPLLSRDIDVCCASGSSHGPTVLLRFMKGK